MQYSKKYIISLSLLLNLFFAQNVIHPGFFGEDLFNYIQNNYQASSTLGYNNARDVMYSEIDLKPGNQLTGVYSGYTITLDLSQDPSTNAYDQGINCEHTWPQSLGAGSEPMKSDMHHLFPTKSNVNSSRGNDPFADIPDINTDKWYRDDYYIETIPNSDIDEYAEKWNPPNQDDERFEPREQQKGDTARAMFYFYTIYENQATAGFWELQEQQLIDWHFYDLPDQYEINRSNSIASYQGNNNPYVIDPSLVGRIFLIDEGTILGDMNGDSSLDVLDLIVSISYIVGQSDLVYNDVLISDANYDLDLDILDIVILVNSILQ